MTKDEFEQSLLRLKLSPPEAAQLLSVSARTVRRWQDGEEVPGPAQMAIRAWVSLHERHLAWRPDSVSIEHGDEDQIARHRAHTIDLDRALKAVEARGGAKLPWMINWNAGFATLGPMTVSFYKLRSGSFSLGTYRRSDSHPDAARDAEMIEDAIYCISKTLERKNPNYGPVTLVGHDGPAKGRVASQSTEQFPTANAAVKRACERMNTPGFHTPFIVTPEGEALWEPQELQRECVRRSKGPPALASLAEYVDTHSALFVRHGQNLLAPTETAQRQNHIKALAKEISVMSVQARDGLVQYQQFEEVLGALHAAGFFPAGNLVSDVAKALGGFSM